MSIIYSIDKSPLGYVLMAATARGIAAVRFGNSESGLRAELVRTYPLTNCEQDEEALGQWVTQLQNYLQGLSILLTVPLDVHGTAFQWKVWKALQAIPSGNTRSYREIAQAIGQPTAARAVARACATNPVAVFIPCHRVIRDNGQLGGYYWGLERKQLLLNLERNTAS